MAFTAMAPGQMMQTQAAGPNPTYGGPGGPMPSGPALGTASPSPPFQMTPPPPPGLTTGVHEQFPTITPGGGPGQQNPFMGMPPQNSYWGNYAGGAAGPWREAAMPEMPGTAGGAGMPTPPGMGRAPGAPNFGDGTQFGGQSTVNAQANPADYGSVQGFADSAYQQSMRYLQPQMDQQNRRTAQDLINAGLDPTSAAGQAQLDQVSRGQNDAMSKAAFDALGFGQGIQNQMFGQDLSRSQLASQNQANLWGALNNRFGTQAGIYGNQLGFGSNIFGSQAGMYNNQANNNASMYNAQLGHSADMGRLDVLRQQQDWGQLMDMERNNQWTANFNRQGDQWRTNLGLELAGFGGINQPSMGGIGAPTQNPAAPWGDLGTNLWGWGADNGGWGGGT